MRCLHVGLQGNHRSHNSEQLGHLLNCRVKSCFQWLKQLKHTKAIEGPKKGWPGVDPRILHLGRGYDIPRQGFCRRVAVSRVADLRKFAPLGNTWIQRWRMVGNPGFLSRVLSRSCVALRCQMSNATVVCPGFHDSNPMGTN